MDEYLDLVNERDEVIGRKLRSEIYAEKLLNFRVVNAFLINLKGELWIPKRSHHKPLFPGCLDMSMGGHVESGETYDQAFKRELQEELNLNADDLSWKVRAHLHPQYDKVSVFMQVYEIYTDLAPKYNPDEFIESFWIQPAKLLQKIEEGTPSKSDLPILIRRLYTSEYRLMSPHD